jgi:crossover junction endodeoxyribonuclease RusA
VSACSFVVYGVPQPQGSLRAMRAGGTGRAIIVSGGSKEGRVHWTAWRTAIDVAAREEAATRTPLDEPVCVTIGFWLPRPKSTPKRVLYPAKKPDLDRLSRSVLDSLTGTIIRDDALVVDLRVRKRFAVEGPPRAEITVHSLEGE